MALVLNPLTSHRLGVEGVRDIDGDPVTNATVEATMLDRDGNEVAGTSWPVALTHDTAGNYYVTLDADLDIKAHKRYIIEITATSGLLQSFWREDLSCEYADED